MGRPEVQGCPRRPSSVGRLAQATGQGTREGSALVYIIAALPPSRQAVVAQASIPSIQRSELGPPRLGPRHV